MSFLRVLHRPPRSLTLLVCRHSSSAATNADVAAPKKPSTAPPTTPLSSCVPDTKLEGMNYLKGQTPVLSRPDDQYPEWLWTVLKTKVHTDDGPGGGAERVKRRAENKQRIKDRNFMSTQ